MRTRVSASLFLLIFVCGNSSFATNFIRGNVENHVFNSVERVAVIDADDRMTEEEYARANAQPLKEVQARFAATGVLTCGQNRGSAQLTGNDQTLTTVAHNFIDLDCKGNGSPLNCSFRTKVAGKEVVSEVSELVATGNKCPMMESKRTDDWAVLKLKIPLAGVRPYRLPDADLTVNDRDPLVAVAGQSVDFRKKSIENCASRQPYYQNREFVLFASNCDSSRGASGGSVLRERFQYDVLVGLIASNEETDFQQNQALKRGRPNSGPYVESNWATYSIPLTGKFLQAVQRAVGNRKYYSD